MRKTALILALALLLPGTFHSLSAFEMAKGEKGFIVLPEKFTPAEGNGANILRNHLEKMLKGSRFALVREKNLPAGSRNVIYVGMTKKFTSLYKDYSSFKEEELLIENNGNDLILAGGAPRGALYAVYEFLEKMGVAYVAKDASRIPELSKLVWKEKPYRRTPAFRYRAAYTDVPGGSYFLPFNKCNFHANSGIRQGGHVGYSAGGEGHSFTYYSRKFPLDDPKVFVYNRHNGRRMIPSKKGEKTGLCPSYPKTADLIFEQMKKDYARELEREKQGFPIQIYFEVSLDDDRSACGCQDCLRIEKEEGCFTGVMLRLVNDLAGRLRKLDKRLKVTFLAYQQTCHFPKKTRPAENVIPRLCVQDNEWFIDVYAESINPVTHKNNKKFKELLDNWINSSKSMGIWEYWTYFAKPVFPHVALDVYSGNTRYYASKNVEITFMEFERFRDSFFALKWFLAYKLMDNPFQDRGKLIDTFMEIYYGKAAPVMKQYLYFLDNEVKKESLKAPMGPRHPKDYAYLNKDFYKKSYELLAKAEKAAGKDAKSLKHVQFEYMALDLSLFIFQNRMIEKLGLAKKDVLARIRKVGYSQNNTYIGPKGRRYPAEKEFIDNWVAGYSIEAPLPKGISGDEVFDYKYNTIYSDRRWSKVVKDPDAVGGHAVELAGHLKENKYFHQGKFVPFHTTAVPFPIGVYNPATTPKYGPIFKLEAKDIPQDEKYHVYKIGRHFLMNRSRIFLHWTWHFQFHPRESFMATPDYYNDIYISLKLTGPVYVKGSKKKNGIFVDRVIITRSKADMLKRVK